MENIISFPLSYLRDTSGSSKVKHGGILVWVFFPDLHGGVFTHSHLLCACVRVHKLITSLRWWTPNTSFTHHPLSFFPQWRHGYDPTHTRQTRKKNLQTGGTRIATCVSHNHLNLQDFFGGTCVRIPHLLKLHSALKEFKRKNKMILLLTLTRSKSIRTIYENLKVHLRKDKGRWSC